MNDRLFDMEVAEKVMGLKKERRTTALFYHTDEEAMLPSHIDYCWEFTEDGNIVGLPNYHKVEEDYDVLQFVMEKWKWDNNKMFAFTDSLGMIWHHRAYDGTRFEGILNDPEMKKASAAPQLSLCRMYKAGDYSRAALQVVKSEEKNAERNQS